MDVATLFDADIDIEGPDPEMVGTFFVKRRAMVDHDEFMLGLLGALADTSRLVMHHRTGFAVVVLPYGDAQRLKTLPWVATVGGIQINVEQFASVTGMQPAGNSR